MKALIINYNRITLPVKMAEYLSECGVTPIIIDNGSTYKPLLKYYENSPYMIVKMNHNYGHNVVWEANLLTKLNIEGDYIVTDSDLDISHIPKDFLTVLQDGLKKYPEYQKCGFSLRINDLPNNNLKSHVINAESNYWDRPKDNLYFDASIDTTFALYRTNKKVFKALRTNEPYSAIHVPWYYSNVNELPEDEIYYLNNIQTSTFYSKLIK